MGSPLRATCLSIVMLGVSISLGAISASAQQPQTMEDAVTRISEAISHSKMKRVVVFDFVGPGDYVTQLGGDLAEEFSSMLAGRAPKLKLDPPPQTRALLTKKGYAQPALFDSDSAVNFARSIKQQGMIWGTLSSEPGGIKFVLSLHKPDPKWTAIESAEVL